jgi:hypothetical protein
MKKNERFIVEIVPNGISEQITIRDSKRKLALIEILRGSDAELSAIRALTRLANRASGVCEWTQDDEGTWSSGCGRVLGVIDDDSETKPTEVGWGFCPDCGKKIKEIR